MEKALCGKQRAEALNLTACKELNSADNQMTLRVDPSQLSFQIRLQPWLDCSLVKDYEAEDSVKLYPDS